MVMQAATTMLDLNQPSAAQEEITPERTFGTNPIGGEVTPEKTFEIATIISKESSKVVRDKNGNHATHSNIRSVVREVIGKYQEEENLYLYGQERSRVENLSVSMTSSMLKIPIKNGRRKKTSKDIPQVVKRPPSGNRA